MQTKHLCVLIDIWTKGEVGASLNRFKPSSKIFLLTVPMRCFFCGSFMLYLSCFVILSCTSVCWCRVVTCWERADLVMSYCDVVTFPSVSWVRCGAWLYRFLIFALFLILSWTAEQKYAYFQTGMSANGTIHITMMKNWVSHILFLRKRGAYRIPGSAERGGGL